MLDNSIKINIFGHLFLKNSFKNIIINYFGILENYFKMIIQNGY